MFAYEIEQLWVADDRCNVLVVHGELPARLSTTSRPKFSVEPADSSLHPEAAPALVVNADSVHIVRIDLSGQIRSAIERKCCAVARLLRQLLCLIGEAGPSADRIGKRIDFYAKLLLQNGSGVG